MFKVYHPNNGNARWTDKMKSYEYQQKIEKILSPNRRRFINIIGEYIMECQSLNLIAVGAGILFWKLLQGFKMESHIPEVFWMTLMAIQYSRINVFLRSHIPKIITNVSERKEYCMALVSV